MKDKAELTQWHPAFCSAIELTFWEEDTMCQAMLDLMKPEIDQVVEQAVEQAKSEEKNSALESLAKWLMSQNPSLSEKEALDSARKILS